MALIPGTIGQVVEDVDNTGEGAEHREGRYRANHRRHVEQVPAEQCPGEHEQVLRPLLRPERGQKKPPRRHARGITLERGIHRVGLWSGGRQRRTRYHSANLRQRYTLVCWKLRMASASLSCVSNPVRSFVMARRSVIRFVRLSSFRLPPWRLTVVNVRTISPSPALSM